MRMRVLLSGLALLLPAPSVRATEFVARYIPEGADRRLVRRSHPVHPQP